MGAVAADDVAEARLRDRSAVILQSHADTGIVQVILAMHISSVPWRQVGFAPSKKATRG